MNTGTQVRTAEELAAMFDHTLLSPHATDRAFLGLCEESMRYGFHMVAVNGAAVERCLRYLAGSRVKVGAAVSFPLGQCTLETKLFETRDAIGKGAGEIDYVINIAELKNGNFSYIENEMDGIVSLCRHHGVVSKVIFENCYLTDAEKRLLCSIASRVGPDFVKTSTGFGEWGARVEDVRLMKEAVGSGIGVKAAGGIRDLATALAMIEAGAGRLGASASVRIVEEYRKAAEGRGS